MDGFIRIQFKKWTQMQTSNETKDELYSKAQTQTPQTWKNHEKAKKVARITIPQKLLERLGYSYKLIPYRRKPKVQNMTKNQDHCGI